ncbi:MAG: hypothetical protein M3P98_04535 [bacterium]|nr:hypothetical protein [bacterium]
MKEKWSSKDFYSCALIRASGIPLSNVVKMNGNFCTFFFDASTEECEELLRKHWDRTLLLPTRNVIDSIVELKTRIHGF